MNKLIIHNRIVALLLMFGSVNCVSAQQTTNQEVIKEMTYAIGMSQTQGLKEYLVNSRNVDLNFLSSFEKGVKDGVEQAKNQERKAYYVGIEIGNQIANNIIPGLNRTILGDTINLRITVSEFMRGFLAGLNASEEELEAASEKSNELVSQVKSDRMLALYSDNKIAGENFLKQNKLKPGIIELPSGLQYKVLKRGTGRIPSETDLVRAHYEGKTIDGMTFDSSYERGEPGLFRPNQVIAGWKEVLTKMPVGSIWEVFIPQDLAYGANEQGKIKPFSVLVYKIELLAIEKE